MRLQADFDAVPLGDQGGLFERVGHQGEVHLFAGPGGFGAFVGVDDGAPAWAAQRIAIFRYSTLISGLHSGVWEERPDSLMLCWAQRSRTHSGSSNMETEWKYPPR
jgi:hypothetical protein